MRPSLNSLGKGGPLYSSLNFVSCASMGLTFVTASHKKPLAEKIPIPEMTPSAQFVPPITLPLKCNDVIKTQTFYNLFDWFGLASATANKLQEQTGQHLLSFKDL